MDDNKGKDLQQAPDHKHHHHHHRRFHVWRWISNTILVIALFVGGGAYYFYHTLRSTADHTYIPLDSQKSSDLILKKSKPISILLMGTDTGALGRTETNGRSDTMIVATLNPSKKTTTMVSIPRDTMAKMIGYAGINIQKINAAYSIGGVDMAVKTTTSLVSVPISYYAVINMGGLEKIVDSLGGIKVTPTISFNNSGYTFTKGRSTNLNGRRALAYIRMRYDDPKGDYGRQDRERQVITAVIKTAPALSNLTKFEQLMNQVQSNFRTNLSFDDMVTLYSKYKDAGNHVKQDHLQGVGTYLNGSSYQIASTKELQRISNLLNQSLDLPTKPVNNEETKQNTLNPQFNWNVDNSNVEYIIRGADQVN
ncbi:LCP family glycopolymer transferase [Lacticaseibacillus paracasei]|uniref:LCP family glycopolymer transferase n=1 Tax=Lacticaseibacillus paracasei TaxID=1597 RepID=UPI000FF171FF|nr:LCP family protein [Lacticaseibacillus paracasei]RWZ67203.1 LytR family transcriptional regulator [Lacticaseibacillus paracasei]